MKKEENNLESLKGKNPFTVPDGYMEGLTAQIMSQLPEKQPEGKEMQISLMDRVRPWLYMAAVFAGLGLFFKTIISMTPEDENSRRDSLLVKSEIPVDSLNAIQEQDEEDAEYLEYIEAQYADYLLAEEIARGE